MSEDKVEFGNQSGSKVTVHLHGATVISWVDRGKEILFCSKDAIFNNKKAIRGGIPLVFPNFGPWSLGPQHGFARIKRWSLESPAKEADDEVTAVFSLVDDQETRDMWDYKFKLLYTVSLGKDFLKTTLTVSNTGDKSFDYTTLLHTYFRVNIENTSIVRLKGLKFVDKVNKGNFVEDRELVKVDQEYDRVYQDVAGKVEILQEKADNASKIDISTNAADIVVWNPWEEKASAMADFGSKEYKDMVCVEAGMVSSPYSLAPGSNAALSQVITVTQPKSNV